MQRTLSSEKVKPRPARTLRLYLRVGHRTIGRSLSTGRGARAAALTWRAVRREAFLPGYSKQSTSASGQLHPRCKRARIPGRNGCEPSAASPCGSLSMDVSRCVGSPRGSPAPRRWVLTVVDELLVVLDRLKGKKTSASTPQSTRASHSPWAVVPLCLLAIKLAPVVDVR